MTQSLTVTDRAGLINRISDAALRMLIDKRVIDNLPNLSPAFYAWPRGNRLVLVLDPQHIKNPDTVLSERFRKHLSLVLQRLPVSAIGEPVLALQIGFEPIVEQVLISKPLDLTQQPSPLHVPLGVSRRGDLWLSIVEMDSVMIGGLRRLGKTNLLHTWIQALAHGGACEVWMWDGKPNNNEFIGYAGRPNIELIGYDQLHRYLGDLTAMLDDRSALFARSGVSNLAAYNRAVTADQAIAPIVLIIDEAAEINHMPNADDNLTAIGRLISIGGAYGIYPVIATQKPTADAVKTIIKSNLKIRIALPVSSNTDSRVILDRGGAEKLVKQPGRLLINWGAEPIECQAFTATVPAAELTTAPLDVVMSEPDRSVFTPQAAPTADELALALRCKRENQDRFTEEWLRAIGYSQDKARELRRVWRAREWVMPNASVLGKPLCLSEYIYALLLDLPTEDTEGPRQPTEGEI
jgi:hypothetical protein